MFFSVITKNLNWEIKNLVAIKRWDALKMKKFNIQEVHCKNKIFRGGGGSWDTNIKGELPK